MGESVRVITGRRDRETDRQLAKTDTQTGRQAEMDKRRQTSRDWQTKRQAARRRTETDKQTGTHSEE